MKKLILSEDERTRILEMHKTAIAKEFLIEGFQDPLRAITWGLNFKDQDTLNSFLSPTSTDNTQTFSTQGYAGQFPGSGKLSFSYWATLAMLGIKPSEMVNPTFETILSKYAQAANTLSNNQILQQEQWNYGATYASLTTNTKWWTTPIIDPQDQTKKLQITRWALWYRLNILPNNAAKESLIATTPTTVQTKTKPK